jgi:hypothetical protein
MFSIWNKISTYRNRHPIGYRLILYTLLFSSTITITSTVVQLNMDYRRDVSTINQRLEIVKKIHLKGIVNSVWSMDNHQTRTLLEGILQESAIKYLEIKNGRSDTVLKVGKVPEGGFITVTYPLDFVDGLNRDINLGSLVISASLQGVYDNLRERLTVLVVANGIKACLVSIFIIFLFQYLVTVAVQRPFIH